MTTPLSFHVDQLFPVSGDKFFYVFMKDVTGKYIGCNRGLANILGCDSESDLVGVTDFDLCWRESAALYQANDQKVIQQGQSITLVEPGQVFDGRYTTAMSYKFPLRAKDNRIMGVVGVAIPLENLSIQHDIKLSLSPEAIKKYKLTKRQFDCVSYLIRGMTIKEIAFHLHLSARTVEHYLEAVKDKLNCHSRSQLIAKLTQELM